MLYGQAFGVDVAFGDPILGEPEIIVGEDLLDFVGIAPPTMRIDPVTTHVAEKLHAYTLPRRMPSTRVKDLTEVSDAARGFLDPVLASAAEARWDPARWTWVATE